MFAPLAAYARRYAKDLQYAVVAIDAPSHGARATPGETARFAEKFRQRMTPGDGVGGAALNLMMQSAAKAVPEWKAVVDEVQSFDFVGAGGPIGYIGLSLGAMIGIPLVASEPRISAAVFGLAGLRPETQLLGEAARQLTVPVEFLVQWDDDLVPRGAALSLFDAIGSAEKTLHANPGGHGGVPLFERFGWMQFFIRHLGGMTTPS
jgi:dienelactone hydrolase